MKRTLLFILFVSLVGFGYSQITLTIQPNPVTAHGEPDETDIEADAVIINNTNRPAELLWHRNIVDKPDEWETWVCDNNLCYTSFVESCPENNPVVIAAGDTAILQVHMNPKDLLGCGTIDIDIVSTTDPETVVASGRFNFDVNNGTCTFQTSGINEVEVEALKVLPNPTYGTFELSNATLVDRVEVYNVVGKLMRSFNDTNNNVFDIGDLQKGLYVVSMLSDEGKILKTVRVSKM